MNCYLPIGKPESEQIFIVGRLFVVFRTGLLNYELRKFLFYDFCFKHCSPLANMFCCCRWRVSLVVVGATGNLLLRKNCWREMPIAKVIRTTKKW